jgi:hypothetical protein
LLLEVGGRGVHWSEPRDLTMDEAIELLTGQSSERFYTIKKGYFVSKKYSHDGLNVRVVAWLDGHTMGHELLKNPADARALLTKSGGEEITEFETYDYDIDSHLIGVITHWGRIWGVLVWLVVVLLSTSRAARRKIWPTSTEQNDGQEAGSPTKLL